MQHEMRLNKYLASCGISSRRKADELIAAGLVTINDRPVTQLGEQIDPEHDVVALRGKVIQPAAEQIIYLLHKPLNVITTAHDPQGRPTVLDFVPKTPRVFPCGRLDEQTSGLVLLTNDGELCYRLTHPKFEHQKEYFVEAIGSDCQGSWQKLQRPLRLNDGPVQIDQLRLESSSPKALTFYLTLHDGRNRIVRRICTAVGLEVKRLVRTKLGVYELGDLPMGEYRKIKAILSN